MSKYITKHTLLLYCHTETLIKDTVYYLRNEVDLGIV